MNRIKEIFGLLKSKLNKYWIAAIVAVFFTFIVGESNIFKRIEYNRQHSRLLKEIRRVNQEKANNQHELDALQSDNEMLERLARERYQMLKEDEELFLIQDK
ncbi:MAG: septum formation initiator family protein [Candidatus Symbiothrix sp.]|jgi:cell division protein FtsB|nr:septum formation initiator family protein [Candidatus Symbiothrix sp.]